MIKRIVKLTFRADAVEHFREIFSESKKRIIASEGCYHLELLQQVDAPNVFFTYSYWEDETALDNYRQSDFFQATWKKTKALFDDRPQAWSLHMVDGIKINK